MLMGVSLLTQTQDSAFRQDVSVWGKKQSLPYMDLGPMAEPFLRSIKAPFEMPLYTWWKSKVVMLKDTQLHSMQRFLTFAFKG